VLQQDAREKKKGAYHYFPAIQRKKSYPLVFGEKKGVTIVRKGEEVQVFWPGSTGKTSQDEKIEMRKKRWRCGHGSRQEEKEREKRERLKSGKF